VKQIILVAGHAGSGKTEFARQLALKTSWPLLDKDTMTRPLVDGLTNQFSDDPRDRDSPAYIRRLEYKSLLAVMWEMLDFGSHGVVVSAPFAVELSIQKWVDDFVLDCDAHSCKLLIVWVHCDPATLKERIVARGAERDRRKLANWPRWIDSLSTPELDKKISQLIVDNTVESAEPMQDSVYSALDLMAK
jgi:dephospho-CoA kinase